MYGASITLFDTVLPQQYHCFAFSLDFSRMQISSFNVHRPSHMHYLFMEVRLCLIKTHRQMSQGEVQ